MSLGALLQRGPDHLDLGVVQLGRASGSCPSPQARSTVLLPHPPPTPHALGTHPHRPRDLRIRDAALEQRDRPNTTRLRQLRPRQRRKAGAGNRRGRLICHPDSLPPTPTTPTELTKRSVT